MERADRRGRAARAFRRCLAAAAAVAAALALLVLPQLADRAPLFTGAETYTFYAGSCSSNAQILQSDGGGAAALKWRIAGLTGESARYASAEEAFAQVGRLGGRLRHTESAGGVDNYYYYSPRLGGGVALFGTQINLHVAVRGAGAAVGSPLIFGGY